MTLFGFQILQGRIQLINLCILCRNFLIVFHALLSNFLNNLIILSFDNLCFGLFVDLFFIRTRLLSRIEAHGQVLGDLLLYNLHSFFDKPILLSSLDTDFEISFLRIEIPFSVLLTLLQEKPLPIVLSILEVCHIKNKMRYLLSSIATIQADGQSRLLSLGGHASISVQREHCVNLKLLVENCRVYILRQLLILRLRLLLAPRPNDAHGQITWRIVGVVVGLIHDLVDL